MASSFNHRAAPVTLDPLDPLETELPRSEATGLAAPQLLSLAELAQVAGGSTGPTAVTNLPVNGW